MDIMTVLGLLIAFGGVIGGLMMEGGHLGSLVQVTAFMIVIVGSLGATFVATPPADIKLAARGLKMSFLPPKRDFKGMMAKLLELATLARREGLLALETFTASGEGDPFLVKCLNLAIDGSSAEAIRETVEVDMMIEEEDAKAGLKFWETWGALCPTVGVLGAVLGLIHVMENLDNPAAIGHDLWRRLFKPRVPAAVLQAQALDRTRPASERHGARRRRRHSVGDGHGGTSQPAQCLPRQRQGNRMRPPWEGGT